MPVDRLRNIAISYHTSELHRLLEIRCATGFPTERTRLLLAALLDFMDAECIEATMNAVALESNHGRTKTRRAGSSEAPTRR